MENPQVKPGCLMGGAPGDRTQNPRIKGPSSPKRSTTTCDSATVNRQRTGSEGSERRSFLDRPLNSVSTVDSRDARCAHTHVGRHTVPGQCATRSPPAVSSCTSPARCTHCASQRIATAVRAETRQLAASGTKKAGLSDRISANRQRIDIRPVVVRSRAPPCSLECARRIKVDRNRYQNEAPIVVRRRPYVRHRLTPFIIRIDVYPGAGREIKPARHGCLDKQPNLLGANSARRTGDLEPLLDNCRGAFAALRILKSRGPAERHAGFGINRLLGLEGFVRIPGRRSASHTSQQRAHDEQERCGSAKPTSP